MMTGDESRCREALGQVLWCCQWLSDNTGDDALKEHLKKPIGIATEALGRPARICDKYPDRHKAIYDCRTYLAAHGIHLTSKQDDVMCQTIYWLYDPTPNAEVHYDK